VVDIAPGRRHSIPGIADCRACHDSDRTEILGFTALQLSTDRDPLAAHAEPLPPAAVTLRTLVDEGLLAGPAVGQLVSDPPRIRADRPVTRAALGYLSTNCGACHHAQGTLSDLGLALRQPARGPLWTDAHVTQLLARTTKWQRPGAGGARMAALRPGDPEHSVLLHRMRSRRPSSQMPPLGTVLPDEDALALLTRWVAAMGPG
jgi:hypothetical protein